MTPEQSQRNPLSLRLRLVLLATLVLMISLGLVGFALDSAFHKSSEAGLKTRMESLVYLVLAATEVDTKGALVVADDPGDPRLGQPGSGTYARLNSQDAQWSSSSSLGIGLPDLPGITPGESIFAVPTPEIGFYAFRYGVSWQLADGRQVPVTVEILVDPQELLQEVQAFRAGLSRSLVSVGVILVLAQLLFLALGLRPLKRITRDIAGIESGELQRLEGAYPRELDPLIRNLNRLLDTEKANQTRYRNALDSLAHSLKTPLSVIRTSLPADTDSKSRAIEHAATDMQHLIATRLQRAAVSTRRTMAQAVDVATQVERLIQSLTRVYSHQMIKIDASISVGLAFFGEQRDLLEVLGNLLDNACKYGHGKVRITAGALVEGDPLAGIRLQVEDNGPGISESKRQPLLKRGVRGDERAEGHGLGLAIVLEVVSAYSGDITIGDSSLGGADISVVLRTN